MENISMIIPITFLVPFFQFAFFITSEQPPYIQTDNITLNCKALSDSHGSDGRFWAGDKSSKFGPFESSRDSPSAPYEAANQGGFVKTVPYMNARVSSSEFKYNFPEFCLNVEENQGLELIFSPTPSSSNDTYAFINGIEIVSMPPNLYYTPSDLLKGSGLITDYILSESYFTVNTTVPLNYAMIPKYTAPEEVYQTARTMGPDGDYNKKTQHNMGIARGFRIHVYASNVPSYKDYVLLMSKEENKQDITIALHPKYYNVILNGIEVFKVNGSDGNLARPNPEPLLAPPPPESFNPTSGKSKTKRRVVLL
ncbi:Uncharacterized protein TCM_018831 [Theobroma cacao]|uniref:Malectin-like domain-containing protein n=1 Tax=Theobroma cacao TaxID=3641 RepID=A0A061EH56_THECC|nr:Uncharacterized protein TCM_018831 [Theobroma cacao]